MSRHLEERDLVLLAENQEAGNALGEVDDVSDGGCEALGELLGNLRPVR